MKTTLLVPDLQVPLHDPLMLKKLVAVAKEVQPDTIFQIGDGIDFRNISRWTIGTAAAYKPVLQKDIDSYRSEYLEPMREACPKARMTWLAGNHDERLYDFVNKYGYQLGTLRALTMENLFGLDDLNVQYVHGPVNVATNVYAIHGHEAGGYSATLSAWDTKFSKRYGSDKSYVFGHTHQPGITTRAHGWAGKTSPRFTMNVGSLMDPTKAKYVKDGAVSWTMSFGLLRDDGKRVWPELILATDRGFWFEGKKW